ncbi:hypothetical protein DFJ58DRAFT_842659 [Suillus subalutaceus]|uniref:uncharacterized protein n=1 Tax=Suillus subalutaceus TaxID=48586 RepID=UPI001B87F516|nr:uncharacterized protein DFJ58DRAFT_842659 [Suillus subalutaceus]KAG1849454.1 hypothetical protein DFJ58DRAFT_842659 [Suillus subalutaceus]
MAQYAADRTKAVHLILMMSLQLWNPTILYRRKRCFTACLLPVKARRQLAILWNRLLYTLPLSAFKKVFHKKDKATAASLLLRHTNLRVDPHLTFAPDHPSAIGLHEFLLNTLSDHTLSVSLDFCLNNKQFKPKFGKHGFDPTGSMMAIGTGVSYEAPLLMKETCGESRRVTNLYDQLIINLRLELKALHRYIVSDWDEWVHKAPASWKDDGMGKTKQLRAWIRLLKALKRQTGKWSANIPTFAICPWLLPRISPVNQCLGGVQIPEDELLGAHNIIYDSPNSSFWQPVNLEDFPA